jgi:hypothetical protein
MLSFFFIWRFPFPDAGTCSIILHTLWEQELMAPKSGSCFGTPLHAYHGVRQGCWKGDANL